MIFAQTLVIAYWIAFNFYKKIKPGKAQKQKYNVLPRTLVTAINATVLYFGGFWDCLF